MCYFHEVYVLEKYYKCICPWVVYEITLWELHPYFHDKPHQYKFLTLDTWNSSKKSNLL